MVIATEKTAETFLNIIAGVPLNNPYPLFLETELEVIYGQASLVAVYNTDYTVTLSSPNYDQFTVTPLAPLLTKIDNLIAADEDDVEINYVTVRRKLTNMTSVQPETVRGVAYLSREIDRIHMKLIQINEGLLRALTLPTKEVGDSSAVYSMDKPIPGTLAKWDETGLRLIAGPVLEDEEALIAASDAAVAAAAAIALDKEIILNAVAGATSRNLPMVIATGGDMLTGDAYVTTGGTLVSQITRTSHKSPVGKYITGIRCTYGNFEVDNQGGIVQEFGNTNDILVNAALEYPAGTFWPLYHQCDRDMVIKGGNIAASSSSGTRGSAGILTTDEGVGVVIPPDTQFWIRTQVFITDPATCSWPVGAACMAALGEGATTQTVYSDLTTDIGVLATNTNLKYGPLNVIGRISAPTNSFALIGDSIINGDGDAAAGDGSGNRGWLARAISNSAGYCKLGKSSDKAANLNGNNQPWNQGRRFGSFEGKVTHAVLQIGINDVTAGTAAATIQQQLLGIWNKLAAQGISVYACTILPQTTSTDAWATTVNQTVTSHEANRTAVNDYIRTMPTPLTGVIDAADAAETARNSGIWKVTGGSNTADGIHPNSNGATNIAAGTVAQIPL